VKRRVKTVYRLRIARVALGLLLAGFALLVLGPLPAGPVRVAGVNLLWLYGGVVAPVAAALVTLAAMRPSSRGRPS